MEIKIKKLHPDAILPTYSTDGAAAFDLYAYSCRTGRGRIVVDTGLAFEIPKGYALIIKPRSGMAFKKCIHAFSGTVDSDFRGEVKILLVSEFIHDDQFIKPGERVAQAMILPIPHVTFKEVSELSTTDRGIAGFGSTGQ